MTSDSIKSNQFISFYISTRKSNRKNDESPFGPFCKQLLTLSALERTQAQGTAIELADYMALVYAGESIDLRRHLVAPETSALIEMIARNFEGKTIDFELAAKILTIH